MTFFLVMCLLIQVGNHDLKSQFQFFFWTVYKIVYVQQVLQLIKTRKYMHVKDVVKLCYMLA